ncbi:hypothetical protein C5167_018832 [Papaver somniferum]|uniref:Uncharacterized protein n=1 Tax=Papaver somniferum TaxID=3469 RepID=A0A4Y7IRT2_PAPSO|nr:hypothetical protein C5167_018832 [Papaver somniferum]
MKNGLGISRCCRYNSFKACHHVSLHMDVILQFILIVLSSYKLLASSKN